MSTPDEISPIDGMTAFERTALMGIDVLASRPLAGPALVRLAADLAQKITDAEFPRLVADYTGENVEFNCPTCGHEIDNDLKPATAGSDHLGRAEFEQEEDAAPGATQGYAYALDWGGERVERVDYWVHVPRSGGKPHAVALPELWEVL